MMSIIDKNRHFVSDCDRALERLYKDEKAIEKLIKLQGASEHLKWNLQNTKRSIIIWEHRSSEAYNAFDAGLTVWFNWLSFYWGTFEDQAKRRGLFL